MNRIRFALLLAFSAPFALIVPAHVHKRLLDILFYARREELEERGFVLTWKLERMDNPRKRTAP